jgi:ABC-2 type transport system permease protein
VAVYEHSYRRYVGGLTGALDRILIFPRYAYEEILRSKLFLTFMILCLVWSFVLACLLYVPHNLGFIKAFQLDPEVVSSTFANFFNANFFFNYFMLPVGFMSIILTFVVGPVLVTSDIRNNGLALYFSRPVTRSEYVLGKSLVLVFLLSVISWVPGLLLFLFQSYLEGLSWARDNYRVAVGIFVGSWIWIAVLSLISLALSAYVKWKPVARLSLFLIFFVAGGMAGVINLMLRTDWGSVINIVDMMHVIWARLFGIEPLSSTPLWVAFVSPLLFCGVCLVLLARKLRPYEIVR